MLLGQRKWKGFHWSSQKGNSHLRGWVVLVDKLHSLGIIPSLKVKGLVSSVEMKSILKEGIVVGSFEKVVKKDLRMIGDVVRFQLEEGEVSCGEEKLRRCLVGWFEELPDQLIDFSWLRNFATSLWSLKRGVKISTFRGALFFILLWWKL